MEYKEKIYVYYCKYGVVKKKIGPIDRKEFESLKFEDPDFTIVKSNENLEVNSSIDLTFAQVLSKLDKEIEFYLESINPNSDLEILKKAFINISLDYSKLVELRDKIEDLKESQRVEEHFYRIVYHSFKMYRLKTTTYELVDLVISALGERPVDNEFERIGLLKKLNMSQLIIDNFKELIECRFDLSRNESKNWLKDCQVLTSNYILWMNLSEALHSSLDDIYKKKGFLFSKSSVISWKEGACMNFWEPFNNFRIMNKKDYLKLLEYFK